MASPALVATANEQEGDEWSTTFTVAALGERASGVEFEVGDQVTYDQLAAAGVPQASVDELESGTLRWWATPLEPDVPEDPTWDPTVDTATDPYYTGPVDAGADEIATSTVLSGTYGILSSWRDNKDKRVVVRRGTVSWGYHHFTAKHNTTINVAKTITKHPRSRVDESPTSRVYRGRVNHVKCVAGGCFVIGYVTVRVIVNPKILSDGKPKGVITAYCEGIPGDCPDWVKNAVNAGS